MPIYFPVGFGKPLLRIQGFTENKKCSPEKVSIIKYFQMTLKSQSITEKHKNSPKNEEIWIIFLEIWPNVWPELAGAMIFFCLIVYTFHGRRGHKRLSKKWQANHYHLQVFSDLDCVPKTEQKMASVWFQLRLKKSNTKETKSEQISWFHACARDIHIECSKQFKWKLCFYRSGQWGRFGQS